MADQLETDASLMHFTVYFTAMSTPIDNSKPYFINIIFHNKQDSWSQSVRALKYARARSKNPFHTT